MNKQYLIREEFVMVGIRSTDFPQNTVLEKFFVKLGVDKNYVSGFLFEKGCYYGIDKDLNLIKSARKEDNVFEAHISFAEAKMRYSFFESKIESNQYTKPQVIKKPELKGNEPIIHEQSIFGTKQSCSNCKHCVSLTKHPFNSIYHGSTKEHSGLFACLLSHNLFQEKSVMIIENTNTLCEMHEYSQ